MAATPEDICNLALGRVRAGRIASLSENSAEAIECRSLYDGKRDALLKMHPWGFARVTAPLSLKDESHPEWLNVYSYPIDCLQIRYLTPEVTADHSGLYPPVRWSGQHTQVLIPFDTSYGSDGLQRVLTSLDEAWACYTRRVTEVPMMGPLFVEALAWFMAIDLAIRLGGDSGQTYMGNAQNQFAAAYAIATASTSNEHAQTPRHIPASIRARFPDGYDRHGRGRR